MNHRQCLQSSGFRGPILAVGLWLLAAGPTAAEGPAESRFELELEAGAVGQTKNDVQIPNDETGTRFSLVDVVGNGPWPAGRVSLLWNVRERHGVRVVLAPLRIDEPGSLATPVDFNGETFDAGPVDARYQFNSWRLSYRYRFLHRERWTLRVGFTAKIRDAEIRLAQGETISSDTDVGFVPLAHFSGVYRFAERWRFLFELDALAGGPGRAEDLALKLGYDVSDAWTVAFGYRTVEGGADVDEVYNFAWLHYGVISGTLRF